VGLPPKKKKNLNLNIYIIQSDIWSIGGDVFNPLNMYIGYHVKNWTFNLPNDKPMDHTIKMCSTFAKFFSSHVCFDTSLQDYEVWR